MKITHDTLSKNEWILLATKCSASAVLLAVGIFKSPVSKVLKHQIHPRVYWSFYRGFEYDSTNQICARYHEEAVHPF